METGNVGRSRRCLGEDTGQTLAGYAMILLFVAVACVTAVALLGVPIRGFYTAINRSF